MKTPASSSTRFLDEGMTNLQNTQNTEQDHNIAFLEVERKA